MAVLVSHAMRRYPTSPPNVYSSCGLRDEAATNSWLQTEESESALSRSMRYADPWLYGNVNSPNNLLLTPAFVLCTCPDYINGTKRSSKKFKSSCKKCKGTRLPFTSEPQKFGTVRCYPTTHVPVPSTLRAGTLRASSSTAVRPSILPANNDPYDFMRKSRLAVPPPNDKHKTLSTSPVRNLGGETKKKGAAAQTRTRFASEKYPTIGRKSILECDINPYELMSDESESRDASITLVNGQRIRVRPPVAAAEYEDVEVNNRAEDKQSPQNINKIRPRRSSSPKLKLNEKESDSNRFKSILKKTATFSDTDSSNGPERSPSPAHKSGSHFYLPMPVNTPRKKVQFLVENELICQNQQLTNNDSDENIYEDAEYSTDDNYATTSSDEDVFERASSCTLRRSVSERFIQEPTKVVFLDTMALRPKSRRSDLRDTFVNKDLAKLDGTVIPYRQNDSSSAIKPKTLPPNCLPPSSTDKLNDINYKINPTGLSHENYKFKIKNNILTKDLQIVDNNSININTSENEKSVVKELPNLNSNESIKIVPQTETTKTDVNNTVPPTVPPRKRSNNKQPNINVSTSVHNSIVNVLTNTETSKIQIPITDNASKTVLQINSTPEIHKLQIKNELFPDSFNDQNESFNPQRKTSIMINGDDCYCTVNVNDDIPLYHSSVVVKDAGIDIVDNQNERKTSLIYINGSFNSVDSKDKVSIKNNEKVEVIQNNESSVISNSECSSTKILIIQNNDYTNNDHKAKENVACKTEELIKDRIKPTNYLLDKKINVQFNSIQDILNDPVEAVRRNLVPHVCGKSDVSRRPHDQIQQLIDVNINTANTTNNEFLFDTSNYDDLLDDKDCCSEHSSSTQYELLDPGSDCYTDNSNRSSITEEELANRTKFYELLADAGAIEVSESEDHHYESIKVNTDPIYEEIEIPPPLPSNPPPSNLLDDIQLDKEFTTRSIFEGASKYDILSYLVDAKERGIVQEDSYTYNFVNSNNTTEEEEKENTEPYNRMSHMSTVSDSSEESSLILTNNLSDEKQIFQKAAEVERNDSGVGSETSKSTLSKYRVKQEMSMACEDCDALLESQVENDPLLCRKCVKKRSERKEIIMEIVETEEKYSRDLQIILEEFYQPMLVAGLLTSDQLSAIFLNVEELLENSQALAERLRDAVEIALEQGDEDLLTVNIGKLFIEAAPMLHAFESYCVRQGTASLLLAGLEKDKELLRIFLRVSQMENTMLRRMNLNSFLMVPVQRVTKYPLLLARLYKVTPVQHETREQLKEAQHKIELHLNHMNSETKDVPSKLWRRISNNSGRRSSTEMDLVNIKLRKLAVDVLEWNHDEAKFALEGKLLFTQPTDNNWRKGRTIKLSPINALLVTNGKVSLSRSDRTDESGLVFSRHSGVREAALLLVRDKNGRYSLLREPLYLDRCIIAADPAWQSYFEVQELLGKDTFIFKAEDEQQTQMWYKQLQYHAQGMGTWRKRRNALANIMINGMGLRS